MYMCVWFIYLYSININDILIETGSWTSCTDLVNVVGICWAYWHNDLPVTRRVVNENLHSYA